MKMDVKPLHILFVEDDPHDYPVAQGTLDRSDLACEITWVRRGEEALKLLQAESFDLVLIDFELPGITGLETFQQMLAQNLIVPAVFVTGAGNEPIALEAIKLGAQDYVVKDPDGYYLSLLPTVVRKAQVQWGETQARHQAEEALQKACGELETLVQQRTAEPTNTNEISLPAIAQRRGVEEALRESQDRLTTRP